MFLVFYILIAIFFITLSRVRLKKLEAIELVELFVLMNIYGAFYQENEEKLKSQIKMLERCIKK